jgi:hypothetical protein
MLRGFYFITRNFFSRKEAKEQRRKAQFSYIYNEQVSFRTPHFHIEPSSHYSPADDADLRRNK